MQLERRSSDASAGYRSTLFSPRESPADLVRNDPPRSARYPNSAPPAASASRRLAIPRASRVNSDPSTAPISPPRKRPRTTRIALIGVCGKLGFASKIESCEPRHQLGVVVCNQS
jgi:hypothetical protein